MATTARRLPRQVHAERSRASGPGLIVRGADTDARELTPESAGLYAVATGFQAIAKDDHDNMTKQFPAYDALYAHCQARVRPS